MPPQDRPGGSHPERAARAEPLPRLGIARVLLLSLWTALAPSLGAQPAALNVPTSAPFTLLEGALATYQVQLPTQTTPPYLEARARSGAGARVWFGPRIVLQLTPSTPLESLLTDRPLRSLNVIEPNLYLLDAGNAWNALTQAVELARHPGVEFCRPVLAQDLQRLVRLAPRPNDPRFNRLWHLENRWGDGTRRGPDLGAREAWATSRGQDIVVAVVDDGVELTHPDLNPAASNLFHFDFTTGTTNAQPASLQDYHATLVAGFILARDRNRIGIAGLAPRASLASWKIFNGFSMPPAFSDELMAMFQYLTNTVSVQNHSWGNADLYQLGPTPLEQRGIDRALISGRHGRGVLMIRAAGNGRESLYNANDDGYANDPRVIAVAATDSTGRPADYSNPGACVLVAGFGGSDERALTTTDRQGTAGQNTSSATDGSADYWTSTTLQGTSFSTPQIAGLVSLLLATNPELTIRDVQHILALSSRHVSPEDPDVITNTAGFRHSHNTGFGLPHAGAAVALARSWPLRPALTEHAQSVTASRSIPDDGLRLLITGRNVPGSLRSIPCTPGMGLHADGPTAVLPIVDVGLATNTLSIDLHGRAALILRSPLGSPLNDAHTFEGKIRRAAEAGAAFAILRNDRDTTGRFVMIGTDLSPIPAVMIDQVQGDALASAVASDPTLQGQLELSPASYLIPVTVSLACEHVGLRVQTSHPSRGEVRLTLVSPQGTRSVLQHLNTDSASGPTSEWTYWSTRHFGESSQGNWTVEISDETPGNTGTASQVTLLLRGVAITDSDRDGLDDAWELQWFAGLESTAEEDPDLDGWSNAQEQILASNPILVPALTAALGLLDSEHALLTWNAQPGETYSVESAADDTSPFTQLQVLQAESRAVESVVNIDPATLRLLRIGQVESALEGQPPGSPP